jgi:uncharacterized protein YebE (UPF0316 family)
MLFSLPILLTGLAIVGARILDVSLGTMRTLAIVQGRLLISFFLGFFEVAIWLTIISIVLAKVHETPALGIFYALGYALGTVVGIALERKMAMGQIVIRAFATDKAEIIATALRREGLGVTTFAGHGMQGPVTELLVACMRKEARLVVDILRRFDSSPFYIVESVGSVSKIERDAPRHFWDWISIVKRR